MQFIIFLITAIALYIIFLARKKIESRHDYLEPPYLPSGIPLIGHLLKILRDNGKYYIRLRQQYNMPIYSLAMPGGSKLYVITSTDLIGAVQRQPKALAFPPIGVKFALALAGSSEQAKTIASTNINGEDGNWGLSMDFNKVVYPALTPGASLEAMIRTIMPLITATIDRLNAGSSRNTKIELNAWARKELTVAITDSVYGAANPLRDSDLVDAFWDFEGDLTRIMINIMPSYTASKAYRGRQLLSKAFENYFRNGSYKHGSAFVQARYASSTEHGLALSDTARLEVVTMIGTIVSTVRTVVWMIYHIYSDPVVLSECRQEISMIMSEATSKEGTVRGLDMSKLKSHCPTLGSTFKEVLRTHSVGTSVREVRQDTLLEGTFMLKKNSMIIMPAVVVHSDASLWGDDVGKFNHKRFLKPDSDSSTKHEGTASRKSPAPSSFRAFGGGTTLCPGRHFATNIVMAMTAMILSRFEIVPVQDRSWIKMTAGNTPLVATVENPDHELNVAVKARDGFEEGKWMFLWNEYGGVPNTAVETLI